jgi:hypothetical protein
MYMVAKKTACYWRVSGSKRQSDGPDRVEKLKHQPSGADSVFRQHVLTWALQKPVKAAPVPRRRSSTDKQKFTKN